MHELDYDLDDRDLQYLTELNEEKAKTRMLNCDRHFSLSKQKPLFHCL